VINDFKLAIQKGLKWNPEAMPGPVEPAKFEVGQQVFVAMDVNIRRTPGWRSKPEGDVLGHLTVRTPATIQDGPTQKDSLTWWPVSSTLSNGTPVEGWVADALTDGSELLSAEMPPLPAQPGTGTFAPGEAVTIVAQDPVNVRSTPGYRGKPQGDVVAEAQPATALTIVQGPREADALFWWQVSGKTAEGTELNGWVAEAAPNGVRLLAPVSVGEEIEVGKPFQGQIRMTQGWGSNAAFYGQFTYDGVPLRGHNGLDFGTPMRTPLIAVDGGSVKRTGFDPGGFGNFILLQHAWGESLYAHLEKVQVQRNQSVDSAQVIGLSGNTGASTGPHLHFGIRIAPYRRTDGWGGFANPLPFMDTASFVSFGPVEETDPTPLEEETLENPRP
jgi:murein DD-endopeptidase MepM/ murein hydrolase activator NlpD